MALTILKKYWFFIVIIFLLLIWVSAERIGRNSDNKKYNDILESVNTELQNEKITNKDSIASLNKQLNKERVITKQLIAVRNIQRKEIDNLKNKRNEKSITINSLDERQLDSILTNYRHK